MTAWRDGRLRAITAIMTGRSIRATRKVGAVIEAVPVDHDARARGLKQDSGTKTTSRKGRKSLICKRCAGMGNFATRRVRASERGSGEKFGKCSGDRKALRLS